MTTPLSEPDKISETEISPVQLVAAAVAKAQAWRTSVDGSHARLHEALAAAYAIVLAAKTDTEAVAEALKATAASLDKAGVKLPKIRRGQGVEGAVVTTLFHNAKPSQKTTYRQALRALASREATPTTARELLSGQGCEALSREGKTAAAARAADTAKPSAVDAVTAVPPLLTILSTPMLEAVLADGGAGVVLLRKVEKGVGLFGLTDDARVCLAVARAAQRWTPPERLERDERPSLATLCLHEGATMVFSPVGTVAVTRVLWPTATGTAPVLVGRTLRSLLFQIEEAFRPEDAYGGFTVDILANGEPSAEDDIFAVGDDTTEDEMAAEDEGDEEDDFLRYHSIADDDAVANAPFRVAVTVNEALGSEIVDTVFIIDCEKAITALLATQRDQFVGLKQLTLDGEIRRRDR